MSDMTVFLVCLRCCFHHHHNHNHQYTIEPVLKYDKGKECCQKVLTVQLSTGFNAYLLTILSHLSSPTTSRYTKIKFIYKVFNEFCYH